MKKVGAHRGSASKRTEMFPRQLTKLAPSNAHKKSRNILNAKELSSVSPKKTKTKSAKTSHPANAVRASDECLQSMIEGQEMTNEALRAANEELATVNADLQNTFDSVKVPIVILSRDLSIRRFTPSAEKLLNLIPADMGRPFKNIKIDFEIPAFEKLLSDVMAEVKPHEMEIQSATETWYSLQIQPYKTKESKIDGVVLAFFNIDTLKKREETIRLRALQQTALAEFGLYALQEPEAQNLFKKCSRLCAQILVAEYAIIMELTANQRDFVFRAGVGWHEGLMGTTLSVGRDSPTGYALHSGHPVVIEDLRSDKRFSGTSFLRDHVVVSGMSVIIQGEEKTFGVLGVYTKNPRRFTQNDCEFLQVLANIIGDAVEKNRLQNSMLKANISLDNLVRQRTQELTRLNTELTMLFDAVPAAIWYKDLNNNILRVNKAAANAAGRPVDEIEGKSAYDLFPQADAEKYFLDDLEVLGSGKPKLGIVESLKSKTGETVWVRTDRIPKFDESGNLTGIVVFCINITDLKKIEEQLLYTEKLSAFGKIAGSVAHEFNNPIYGVRNVLEQTSEIDVLSREQQDLLKLAVKECDRMTGLIRQLQDIYRPSTGVYAQIDLNQLVDEVILLLKKKIKERKIVLEKHLSSDLPQIKGVSDQLKQVVLNLLQNAEESIDVQGGKIFIATENKAPALVKIRIGDTGSGIPSDNLMNIFEPFFTTKSAIKGAGLGLSVSHGIIKSHGGDIEVESCVGEGSVFTITLPVENPGKPKPAG